MLLGLSLDQYWKHYILADNSMIKDKCLAIRIPGGTVGGIWINDENIITKIFVYTDYYVIEEYPADINEKLAHFVGEKIEFTDIEVTKKCLQDLIGLSHIRSQFIEEKECGNMMIKN